MDKQTIELAVQTFSIVPEVYQKAFVDSGADFPDELVAKIKENPDEAIELLKADKSLAEAVVNIFVSNQDSIMQAAQDAQNKEQTSQFKKGGKLNQGLQLYQAGGVTRRRALDKAEAIHGYDERRQARQAYRNAKSALRQQRREARQAQRSGEELTDEQRALAEMSNRDIRGGARHIIMNTPRAEGIEKPAIEIVTPISGPRQYNEAIVEVGPLTQVSGPTRRIVRRNTPVNPNPVIPNPVQPVQGGIDDTKNAQLKSQAWYQYQAERAMYDRKNGNYGAGMNPAAYQHWMWKDFNDAWDNNTSSVKRDFIMRSPSAAELAAFSNAGAFTHGVLPAGWKKWSEYGVDMGKGQFYSPVGDRDFRADAQAHVLPATKLYNAIGNSVGSLVMLPAAEMLGGTQLVKAPAQKSIMLNAAPKQLMLKAAEQPLLLGMKLGGILKKFQYGGNLNTMKPTDTNFAANSNINPSVSMITKNPFQQTPKFSYDDIKIFKPSGTGISGMVANNIAAKAKAKIGEDKNLSNENTELGLKNLKLPKLRSYDAVYQNGGQVAPYNGYKKLPGMEKTASGRAHIITLENPIGTKDSTFTYNGPQSIISVKRTYTNGTPKTFVLNASSDNPELVKTYAKNPDLIFNGIRKMFKGDKEFYLNNPEFNLFKNQE